MHQVLVVDDDAGTRETFAFALRAEKIGVSVAETVSRAIEVVQRWTPHIVLCDLNLPDGSGMDVLRQLRQMGIGAPFVIMTGGGSVGSALEAGRLGVADYVEKPIGIERLLQLVRAHMPASRRVAGDPASHSGYAARVRYILEQRYAEPLLGVRAVAQAIGISTQHVCRTTRHQLGLTFADLLRNIRLREARRLLLDRSCSVKEVAFRVGFRHPSQFTRAFKQHYGMSPMQYRNRDAGADADQTLMRREVNQ